MDDKLTPDADLGNDHVISRRGGGGGIPGKRSLTQGLAPRTVILRQADPAAGAASAPRDANGVAAGADAALASAAGGGGAGLRPDLRERFESSLGADLSAVRVHTTPASAEAAAAVGARAYAVGNDIHFAAGQYQPDDPFGLHLLAHEVAHTQQQTGGTPHRQHKLAVSTPGDAAEHEADRAADAMVAGRAAAVGVAPGGVARDAAGSVAQLSQSIKAGPVEIEIAAGSDGKVTVSGGVGLTQAVETGIPGLFVEMTIGGKVAAEGAMNSDGSCAFALGAEVSGQVTLNMGLQQIGSIYGGGQVAVKLPGLTLTRAPGGAWKLDPPQTLVLAGKLVVGAKVDFLPGAKYEVSPGGEKELAVFTFATRSATMGKDLRAAVQQVDAMLVAAGVKEPGLHQIKATASAAQRYVAKLAADERARAAQQAKLEKEKAEYDAANNPAYQNSTQEPRDPQPPLDSCDESNP